jgi:4-hydroxythreonine-4-phosphate dehydrogenase
VSTRIPKIAVTLGDPAGVGGEVILKALADPEIAASAKLVVVGDRIAIDAAERSTGVGFDALGVKLQECGALPAGQPILYGALRAEYGRAAVRYVHDATMMCLNHDVDAMVTAPLNKEAVTLNGMRCKRFADAVGRNEAERHSCFNAREPEAGLQSQHGSHRADD